LALLSSSPAPEKLMRHLITALSLIVALGGCGNKNEPRMGANVLASPAAALAK
jgi:hypothetical protein